MYIQYMKMMLKSWMYWVLPLLAFIYFAADAFIIRRTAQVKLRYPIVGSPFWFMPSFVQNLVYLRTAAQNVQYGYSKFKNTAFQLLRYEGSVVVLPPSLLEELVSLPDEIASIQPALELDLVGRFTGMHLMVESRLHHMIVQRKLIPHLPQLIPRLEESINAGLAKELPHGLSKNWTEIQPYHLLKRVSARLAANMIVGPGLLFMTTVVLRLFPSWMHYLIYPLLPSYWKVKKSLSSAKKLLGPHIQELIDLADSGSWEPRDDNFDDTNVLRWLCSLAKGAERNPDTISHVLVLVVLAAVHNNLFRIINALYDITAAGPDLKNQLLAEITATATMEQGWTDMPYDRLYRLDSVISESQRVRPPTIFGMRRFFRVPYAFKDGTYVPAGTYTCMATHAIENDPENTPHPEDFDGLRYFRAFEERQKADDTVGAKKYLFSNPSRTRLNLGYGKSACPGRVFASLGIKMVLVKLLADYDFSFLPGEGRPGNTTLYEFVLVSPAKKMLIRHKEKLSPF
ncbi:hypothetical protein MGN70_007801 [Eutypa lata]|nr:hypothetical protein MGN70_007801 [Eutypa lata]